MENDHQNRQDSAVAARLRKLRSVPVDLGPLQRRIEASIPRPTRSAGRPVLARIGRPLAAVAASIVIFALLTVAILTASSGQVMASPAEMARFHQEIVANKIPVTRVDSIAEASEVLATQWPQGPDLPQAPEAHVMACCMKSIKDKKVACVLLNSEGTPITMSVANAKDMRSPKGNKVTRNGASYHVMSSGNVNMVSTERNGRWVCLIGETSTDRLIDIAHQLQF